MKKEEKFNTLFNILEGEFNSGLSIGNLDSVDNENPETKDSNFINQGLLNNEFIHLSIEERSFIFYFLNDCLVNDDYEEAVNLYTELINKSNGSGSNLSYFLEGRASVYTRISNWNGAVKDYKRSIELNPGNSTTYINLGANMTWKFFHSGEHMDLKNYDIFDEIIDYYEESLMLDITSNTAWLNLIETCIFIQKWEMAIIKCKESEPYIRSGLWKFRKAWLNGLAMALSGRPIEKEIIEELNNPTIYYDDNHETHSIECTLSALEKSGFDKKKLRKAIEINKKYLKHFK